MPFVRMAPVRDPFRPRDARRKPGYQRHDDSSGSMPREQLTIRMTGGDPIVDYQLAASDEDLAIEMSSRDRWHVRRKPKGNSKIVPIEIDQPAQVAIMVRLGDKPQERTLHVAGIWHLAVIEPDLAKEQVLPLVRFLERDWDLTKTVGEIENGAGGSRLRPEPAG